MSEVPLDTTPSQRSGLHSSPFSSTLSSLVIRRGAQAGLHVLLLFAGVWLLRWWLWTGSGTDANCSHARVLEGVNSLQSVSGHPLDF